MTKSYKLLGFPARRRGAGLLWLGLGLFALAAADHFYFSFLGSARIILWGISGLAILAAILFRLLASSSSPTAVLQLEKDGITIRYRGYQLPVSYGNMDVITGGRISQHYSLNEFSRRQREAIQPYFNQTQIFIALLEETEALRQARQTMPRFLFGTTRLGLLLIVAEDWLTVERDIDAARVKWLSRVKSSHQEEYRSPAAMLWEADDDFEDKEDNG